METEKQEGAGKGVVIEKNERLRALRTVLVVLCGRAMDHLVTSMYWAGDNEDLWWHLSPNPPNTGPDCHNAGHGADGGGAAGGGCPYGAMRCKRQDRETSEEQAVAGQGRWGGGFKEKKKLCEICKKRTEFAISVKSPKKESRSNGLWLGRPLRLLYNYNLYII